MIISTDRETMNRFMICATQERRMAILMNIQCNILLHDNDNHIPHVTQNRGYFHNSTACIFIQMI